MNTPQDDDARRDTDAETPELRRPQEAMKDLEPDDEQARHVSGGAGPLYSPKET